MKRINQSSRLIIWSIYTVSLLGLSLALNGSVIPPTAEKGLWLYSCLASIILGDLLTSPYFNTPADAISNTVAALISLLAVDAWSLGLSDFSKWIWTLVIVFNVFVLILSFIQIVTKDAQKQRLKSISNFCYIFTSNFGNHKWVFSSVIFFALVSFHSTNPKEYISISIAWLLLIGFHPLETLWIIAIRVKELFAQKKVVDLGQIAGHEFPNIALVKYQPEADINLGDPIIIRGDNGLPALGFALDQIGFTGELWHRILRFPNGCNISINNIDQLVSKGTNVAYKYLVDIQNDTEVQNQIEMIKKTLIGIVAPDSDITRLRVELIRTDLDLHEGRLVEVSIGEVKVLYQIINGLTKEEMIEQKSSRGYVRAEARKLGKWTGSTFEAIRWVPYPNAPVFLVDIENPEFENDSIGFIPHTNYHLSVDINFLVTHNTAILGILGVGKTCLALELIERLISSGIKVICLDLTNQYSSELAPYYEAQAQSGELGVLQRIGIQGKTRPRQNVEEGGSIREFKNQMCEHLRAFLNSSESLLRVYNPADYEVWRQDSKMFNNSASMATLTSCEITRLITENVLDLLQESGLSNSARCCMIFEEAHSLIPEWNSTASEGDRSATNGTAKAILQGRKYGLGCLVITQRTANVTKSILNQCNTIFALRTFDATGVEFLKTFVGEDYASILSNLEDRHAVAFGKASSCNTPVMIRLNDRQKFLENYRVPEPEEDIPF